MGVLIFAAGVVAGAALVRYGLGLGERMAWGRQEGLPMLSRYDAPLEQANTAGEVDLDSEDVP